MAKKDRRKTKTLILIGVIAFFNFLSLLSYLSPYVYSRSVTAFTSADKFDIPFKNRSIIFATNGTYNTAVVEDSVWSFENLHLANIQRTEDFNLKVSSNDSEVKITSYLNFTRIFRGDDVKRVILRYTVVGYGTQTFDLGLDPKKGKWNVVLNGVVKGVSQGWILSSEGTPIITGATANVTLFYYGYPDSYLDNTNDLNKHSVIIGSTFFVGIVVISTAIITNRNKGLTQPKEKNETENKNRHRLREEFE
jgi:hypothetical protein